MTSPITVPFGTSTTKKNAVFVIIHGRATIYENYNHVPAETKVLPHRVAFMVRRWDGKDGFPGGMVDATDASFVDAAIRELKEEINFPVEEGNHGLQPLVSHQVNDWLTVHAFHLNLGLVPTHVLRDIVRDSVDAEHFGSEGSLMLVHLENYKNSKGEINNGLIHTIGASNLASAVREELIELCQHFGIEVPAV